MRIKLDGETVGIDFNTVTLAELEKIYTRLSDGKLAIEAQLSQVKAEYAETGEYADARWYQSATMALKAKNMQMETIRKELGRIKRGQRGLERTLERTEAEGIRDDKVSAERKQIENLKRSHVTLEMLVSLIKELHPDVYRSCMDQVLQEIDVQVKKIRAL